MSSPLQNNIVNLQSILNSVNNLPDINGGGVHLPTLSNAGVAADLALGKQLIDGNGNIVIGTHECETDSGDTSSTKTIVPNSTEYGSSKWTTSGATVSAQSTRTVFNMTSSPNSTAYAFISIDTRSYTKMKIVGTYSDSSSSTSQIQLCVGLMNNGSLVSGYYSSTIKNGSSGTINNTYDISNVNGTYYLCVSTIQGNSSDPHNTTVTITSIELS